MTYLCEKSKCTGCMACFNKCPISAISIVDDEEGFKHPNINKESCIKCGACQNVCPILKRVKPYNFPKEVYACWCKDEGIRFKSSSGGVFTVLATKILEKNGRVYGAKVEADGRVVHFRGTCLNDLENMRGSKYVQSEIGTCFQQVKRDLEGQTPVLFTGTPCQVAGLRNYLGKDYEDLICCDLVCHGVPSPKIFKEYLMYMEKKYKGTPQRIWFRDKTKGWEEFCMKIQFSTGMVYKESTYKDVYIRGFLRNLYLRNSCYDCIYTNVDRISDLTIADFWGYRRDSWKARDNDKGISMCIINSKKGRSLYNEIIEGLVSHKKNIKEAVAGNTCLSKSFEKPELREAFWNDFFELGYEYVIEKYCYPEKRNLLQRLKGSRFGIEYGYMKRWIKSFIRITNNKV